MSIFHILTTVEKYMLMHFYLYMCVIYHILSVDPLSKLAVQLAYWKKVRQIQHELYCYLLTSLSFIVVVYTWILILEMYKLIKTKAHSLLSYIALCTQLLYYEIPSIHYFYNKY